MLDLVLGSHPKFVGLGEIFQVLRPDMNQFERNKHCSCGKAGQECSFWGITGDRLRRNMTASLEERYIRVIDVFDEIFGPNRIMVDSSKLLDVLKLVNGLPEVEVKVIHLIRDVRAWTISRLNNRKKSPKHFRNDGYYIKKLTYQYGWKIKISKWIIPYITQLPTYYFWLWYLQNKQIKKFLKHSNIEYFSLGYDELGMNPDFMMQKILKFLGEGVKDVDFTSVNSQSHILVGNTKKTDSKRRQGIFYDNRWMYQNEWLLPAALFPNIMKYNAKEVYKNIKSNSIWDN